MASTVEAQPSVSCHTNTWLIGQFIKCYLDLKRDHRSPTGNCPSLFYPTEVTALDDRLLLSGNEDRKVDQALSLSIRNPPCALFDGVNFIGRLTSPVGSGNGATEPSDKRRQAAPGVACLIMALLSNVLTPPTP